MSDTIFGANKLLRHMDRVLAFQRGEVVPPVTMELDMTDRCNHECPKCAGGRGDGHLDLETATDWLLQMSEYGVRGVIFTGGGEPLLNDMTVRAIECTSDWGMDVGLITNGGPLNCDLQSTTVAIQHLVGACKWIRVSLDAADSLMYTQTHGTLREEFYSVRESIGRLAERKRVTSNDCTIGVSYMVNEDTKRGMLTATKLCRDLNVDYIQFRQYWHHFTPIDDVLPICRQYETETFKVRTAEPKFANMFDRQRPYNLCHGAAFTGVIQADGNVPICCNHRGKPEFYIGNMHEQSLKEIWEGERKRHVLDNMNVHACVPLCRNDHHNRFLENVIAKQDHGSFV